VVVVGLVGRRERKVVWAEEPQEEAQGLAVEGLNLLAGLAALGIRATGLPGLRCKAVTEQTMEAQVVVVSLVVVAVGIPLVVVVALGLPGEPLLLLTKG